MGSTPSLVSSYSSGTRQARKPPMKDGFVLAAMRWNILTSFPRSVSLPSEWTCNPPCRSVSSHIAFSRRSRMSFARQTTEPNVQSLRRTISSSGSCRKWSDKNNLIALSRGNCGLNRQKCPIRRTSVIRIASIRRHIKSVGKYRRYISLPVTQKAQSRRKRITIIGQIAAPASKNLPPIRHSRRRNRGTGQI